MTFFRSIRSLQIIGIVGAAAMIGITYWKALPPELILNIGVGFQILGALLFSLIDFAVPWPAGTRVGGTAQGDAVAHGVPAHPRQPRAQRRRRFRRRGDGPGGDADRRRDGAAGPRHDRRLLLLHAAVHRRDGGHPGIAGHPSPGQGRLARPQAGELPPGEEARRRRNGRGLGSAARFAGPTRRHQAHPSRRPGAQIHRGARRRPPPVRSRGAEHRLHDVPPHGGAVRFRPHRRRDHLLRDGAPRAAWTSRSWSAATAPCRPPGSRTSSARCAIRWPKRTEPEWSTATSNRQICSSPSSAESSTS